MAAADTALASDIVGAFFTKTPQMPQAPQVSAGGSQLQAINANEAALPGVEELAGNVNTFNADQLQQLLQKAIPGYSAINDKASSVIQSELSGQIPQDVQEQVEQSTNANAVAGGYGGSGMGRNLTSRDLGLTSLQLTNQGLASSESWMKNVASLAMPQLFNPSTMFLTPEQVIQNNWQNQTSSFQRNWANNVLTANAQNARTLAAWNIGGDVYSLAQQAYGTAGMGGAGGAAGAAGGSGSASSDASQFGETEGDAGNSSMSGGFDWMSGSGSGGLF